MPTPRQRRALLVGAAIVAFLVAAYAAAGYLVAPRVIRDALVERAAAAGLELRFGAVATHPFSLSIDAFDVQLSTHERRQLFQARHASVDLSAASLWSRAWVLEHVALDAPVVHGLPALPQQATRPAQLPPLVVHDIGIADGRLELEDVPRLEQVTLEAHDLSTLEGHGNRFSVSAKLVGGGSARSEGTVSLAPTGVSGRLALADASLAEAWRYLPDSFGRAPRGRIDGALQYRYAQGRLSLSQASAQARLDSGGSLALRGEVALAPFAADLRLEADAVPVALAQPLLKESALRIAAGTLSGKGRLRLGAHARYQGSAIVRDARIEDREGGLLVAWQGLETDTLRLDFSPFAASAREVAAKAPQVRAVIGPDGSLNLARAFSAGATGAPGRRPDIAVERLSIEGGRLDFADRSLDTPFATSAGELSGALTQLATNGGEPARLQLAGRVGRYGEARVRGLIDLTAPSSRTGLQLVFRNLALPDFTPYAVKFAGYRIRSGRLDAELRYRVRDGRLVGDNKLAFRRLRLGEKVQNASVLDLPLDLAVALLTDAQGRIDLAIPVSGDLRDPRIDLGGLVAQAVRNTLARIVSAPFRALAALFGGGEGEALREVRFDPGAAALPPPAEEVVARLAKALGRRPQLSLEIQGTYDPQADREALQRAALLRELGVEAGDRKFDVAAERLYLSRGGRSADLSALKPRERGYRRRLLDALAEGTAVAQDALPALAAVRAEAIREALLRSGVDPARITLAPAGAAEAGEGGVPATLALRAR